MRCPIRLKLNNLAAGQIAEERRASSKGWKFLKEPGRQDHPEGHESSLASRHFQAEKQGFLKADASR